jgi:HSP20 family protein
MSSQQQSQQPNRQSQGQAQGQMQRHGHGSSQQQRGMNRWNNNYNRRSLFDEIFDSPVERVIKSYFGNTDNNDDIWNNNNMSLMRPFGNNQLMQSSFKSDLVENDKEYQVHADLPGMNKKDINITFKDGQLEIEGKRENKRDEWDKNHQYHHQEVSYGSFYRTWYLPKSQNMNVKNIKAKYDNGVLEVSIPKDQIDTQQTHNKVNID